MTWLRNHGLAVAAFIGIGLLVTAANLAAPPWWLIVPAWAILAICIVVWFESTPRDSPYRVALMFTSASMLVGFSLLGGAVRALVALMFEPSEGHLYGLLTARPFLALAVLFFAFACAWYGVRLREVRAERDGFKWRYEEKFEEAQKWKRVAEEAEGAPTRDGEQVGNFDCLLTDRQRRELEEYEKNRKEPNEMTREELLEETRRLADDNERLNWLLEAEYLSQGEPE